MLDKIFYAFVLRKKINVRNLKITKNVKYKKVEKNEVKNKKRSME